MRETVVVGGWFQASKFTLFTRKKPNWADELGEKCDCHTVVPNMACLFAIFCTPSDPICTPVLTLHHFVVHRPILPPLYYRLILAEVRTGSSVVL